ncbi:hypothetical protein PK654_08510 [Vibrio sp. SCSIO 43137]|nr:hypothetical protein [Vibrio sp. SCSIO 43137]WCE28419.1 hypothetical protein PK654_08510 [Vibrio sp. SCSIO 43137]
MKTHIIRRDSRENYLIGVGNGKVRAWSLDSGVEYPIEGGATEYLNGDSRPASAAYQLMTLGDDTYILNTTASVRMDYTKREASGTREMTTQVYRFSILARDELKPDTDKPYSSSQVLSANIQGILRVGDKVISYNTAPDGAQLYLKNLLAAHGVSSWTADRYVYMEVPASWLVSVDDSTTYRMSYTHTYTHTWRSNGDDESETRSESWEEDERALGVAMSRHGGEAEPLTPESPQAYVWIKQADYSVNYDVILNGVKVSIKTPEATSDRARAGLNSSSLTDQLISGLNAQTSKHGCTVSRVGRCIHIRNPSNNKFTVEVDDGLYGEGLKLARNTVQTQKDLPPDGMEGCIIHVTGAANEDENDGYYVIWDIENNMWQESTKYGLANHFDATSLPHILRRYQKESYQNSKNPYGIYFKLEHPDWAARTVGDEESSPIPSFCSSQDSNGKITEPRSIRAMAFYRGRLWFLGGEYASASVTGDNHNFFRSTALKVLDDDPIDGYTDLTGQAETIHAAIPSSDSLVVFTERGQYAISSEGLMSPLTFQFKRSASYASDALCTPVSLGDRISFTTRSSEYVAVSELYIDTQSGVRQANEVTSHCPTYIKGRVHKLLAHTAANTELLVMRNNDGGATGQLFVYNYLINGSERLQSAWSEWRFNNALVIDGVLEGKDLYLILQRQRFKEGDSKGTPYFTIEKMSLGNDVNEATYGHPIYLDCLRTTEAEPTDLLAGEVKKKLGGKWHRGFPYLMRYTFSPFFYRPDPKGAGHSGGRLQLRRIHLNFHKTTSFVVEVVTRGRETRSVLFQGRVLGDLKNIIGKIPVISGERSFPLLGSSESISVSILNDSVFDSCFQSAYWEGKFHNRARMA